MATDSKKRSWRLSQVARKLNVGTQTIVTFLREAGHEISHDTNAKIDADQFLSIEREFATSALDKEEASLVDIGVSLNEDIVIHTEENSRNTTRKKEEKIQIRNLSSEENISPRPLTTQAPAQTKKAETAPPPKLQGPKVVGKINIEKPTPTQDKTTVSASPTDANPSSPSSSLATDSTKIVDEDVLRAKKNPLRGTIVVDKIELKEEPRPVEKKKRPRKRLSPPSSEKPTYSPSRQEKKTEKTLPSTKEINENIKATLAKLSHSTSNTPTKSKIRQEKRLYRSASQEETNEKKSKKVLHATEFISVSDLAALMDVSVNELISTCMQMGMLVSINQRLDSETISILADEYNFDISFTTFKNEETLEEETDQLPDSTERAPVVTIMGHVDHGKTSLLDHIRNTQVTASESGGITQHIGAYEVSTKNDRKIVFLDTPGHAAFTAMRARGAQVTDVSVIVIAADDSVMPQTEEAINHVKNAGVPFIIAINKIDKEGAAPEKIREQLSQLNILVEEWGGKVQSQEISSKTGQGIDQLLDKLLLEADLLELKANPQKVATGSIIEASLDKGKGYVANLLIKNGTLQIGDVILSGLQVAKIKAMFDYLGQRIKTAGPSTPVQVLGFDGAPQAGDPFRVLKNEKEAREISTKRQQIARQQSIRTKKHITLDEIGRRLALSSFKELNLLVKGDVDGSVGALSDELLKLSTEEVQVNIIHKGVGQISESDVLLATASDAIIIGFQVRPSENSKTLAEKEQIEIRLYSIIFNCINEIQEAIKGMHEPKKEEIIGSISAVEQVFKLSKEGIVAGCTVKEGTLKKEQRLRVIRDGIVIHQGDLGQLKRYKDSVNEVKQGNECGLSIKNYTDIKAGDVIEGFTIQEVKNKLI